MGGNKKQLRHVDLSNHIQGNGIWWTITLLKSNSTFCVPTLWGSQRFRCSDDLALQKSWTNYRGIHMKHSHHIKVEYKEQELKV